MIDFLQPNYCLEVLNLAELFQDTVFDHEGVLAGRSECCVHIDVLLTFTMVSRITPRRVIDHVAIIRVLESLEERLSPILFPVLFSIFCAPSLEIVL